MVPTETRNPENENGNGKVMEHSKSWNFVIRDRITTILSSHCIKGVPFYIYFLADIKELSIGLETAFSISTRYRKCKIISHIYQS